MKCTLLTDKTAADWAGCIPEELFGELYQQKRGMYAMGISAFGEPQGAIVWEEAEQEIRLLSICVRPHARHLGLGGELMKQFLSRSVLSGCRKVTVSYAEWGERCLLAAFLAKCGFFMERTAFPQGEVTLRELTEKLLPQLGTGREGVRPLRELSAKERNACGVWLAEQLELPLARYVTETPASFADVREGEVRGLLLVSGMGEEISLDYCGIRQNYPTVLARLLACAMERLAAERKPETVVRMTLSTPQALALYEKLFGQPEKAAYYCGGSYGTVR